MSREGFPPRLVDASDDTAVASPPSVLVNLFRSENALVVAVDASISDLLGWHPEDLIGKASTSLIHHEDQNTAVAAWFEMIANPGEERRWRGRYQTQDGRWRWVETVNVYTPGGTGEASVHTRMRGVEGSEVSVEERLREREQVLSRLSDALPVGVFQFDRQRRLILTNDRLHAILGGTVISATTDALFRRVDPSDREALEDALAAVLAGHEVSDFDIALKSQDATATATSCSVAMRTLTGRTGEVTGGIGCVSDVTERVQLRLSLESRASTDVLTGCMNRAASIDRLAVELSTSTVGVAAIFLDLDRFKKVNDEHGHAAGDTVLHEVARRLTHAARTAQDWVGRLGGDEFLVICRDVNTPLKAQALARRFTTAVNGRLRLENGAVISVRASAGAAWGAPGAIAETLIAEADREMYLAKTGA